MIDLIIKVATGVRAAIALAALAFGGTLLFRLGPYSDLRALLNDSSLPEEAITSPDRFAEILEALGATGRATYLQFQIWDLLNPVLIGGAGALLLGWLLKRGNRDTSSWRLVVLFPVVLLAADLLENLVIAVGVGAFPDRTLIGAALPLVTATKFGAAGATFVAAILLSLAWLRNWRSGVPRRVT